MLTVTRYTTERKAEWDRHVQSSRNGTFIIERAYMDYHADRFCDHSLMFYDERGRLLAVLPANEDKEAHLLWSHQGLTYGGFILSAKARAKDVEEMFVCTQDYIIEAGLEGLMYKQVPTAFHLYPSQEDEYWLWRIGAELKMCNLGCTIDLDSQMTKISSSRKNYCKRLAQAGFSIDYDCSLSEFWNILENNLQTKYGARPVHTLDEMEKLKATFPERIICVVARNQSGEAEAGTVLYLMNGAVHTQYISASAEGKRNNTLDFLMLNLISRFRDEGQIKYFDFGTNNEQGGRILNETLIRQKEGLGGRGVVYKTWYWRANVK